VAKLKTNLDDIQTSLVDIRIYIALILIGAVFIAYLINEVSTSPDYRFISIAVCLFVANTPTLFYIIGIRRDKAWILSILRIENDSEIPEFKASYLANSHAILYGVVGWLVRSTSYHGNIWYSLLMSIVLGTYFASRTLTQAMGFYIYWIARIDKDTKLKVMASDDLIREQSREAESTNFRLAIMFSIILFIFLFVYIIAEGFFSITSELRIRLIMYCVLSAGCVALCLILSLIYDKNVTLLSTSPQLIFLDEQKSAMQSNLSFLRFLFALFLIAQVTIFFVLVNILS